MKLCHSTIFGNDAFGMRIGVMLRPNGYGVAEVLSAADNETIVPVNVLIKWLSAQRGGSVMAIN